jgi:hypothetical protein
MTQFSRASTLTAAAGLGVLLGGAGMADATQMQNFSLPLSSTTASTTATFDTFDPALGSLSDVVVELSNVIIGGGSMFSITGAEGGSLGSTSFVAALSVTDPSLTSLFAGSYGASAGCTAPNAPQFNQSCSQGPVMPTDQVSSPGSFHPTTVGVPSTDWAAFIGAGSTVDLSEAISSFVVGLEVCDLIGSLGHCTLTNNISWSGTLSLTYDYTPATIVPEPDGTAVLLIGLAGLAWVDRRRLTGGSP